MNKYRLITMFLLLTAWGKCAAADKADAQMAKIGVVNFSLCFEESKYGKRERDEFEILKKQMVSLLTDTENKLKEISEKFNDADYLDGLSPEGEEELKAKYRAVSEEYNRYQQQYAATLQQRNWQTVQMIQKMISEAATAIAKEKKLAMIVNKEACFYYANQLDITPLVISQMDKSFDTENKNPTAIENFTEADVK
jgi:outer membrane protein